MGYQIRFIGESDLPEGVDWVAARGDLGGCCLFVKMSACLYGVAPAAGLRAVRRLAEEWKLATAS